MLSGEGKYREESACLRFHYSVVVSKKPANLTSVVGCDQVHLKLQYRAVGCNMSLHAKRKQVTTRPFRSLSHL